MPGKPERSNPAGYSCTLKINRIAVDFLNKKREDYYMNLKLTPKAQKIIAEKGNRITVSLNKQICYS